MKVFIAEDEESSMLLLKRHISRISGLELVGTEKNGSKVLQRLQDETLAVDLLLLDVKLPGIDGVKLAEVFKDRMHVIFVTGYNEYAVQSYKFGMADFLTKPVTYVDFLKMLEKVKDLELLKVLKEKEFSLLSEPRKKSGKITFTTGVKGNDQVYDLNDITHFTTASVYVHVYFVKGPSLKVRLTLSKIENQLKEYNFMKTHRSYIVNLDKVIKLEKHMIRMENKGQAEVSKDKRRELLQRLNKCSRR